MLRDYRVYLLGAILLSLLSAGCNNTTTTPPVVAPSTFTVTPLTANNASYNAAHLDTNMRDAWGLAFNITYGIPWVANRASATATIYDSLGAPKTTVYHIKGPGGTLGSPTGILQNTTSSSFLVPAAGLQASWIFAELNGTLAATVSAAPGDSSFIVADRSQNSSFTGLALATGTSGPKLYAPNVRNGSLDQFDMSFTRGPQSPGLHTGYTPFNAVVIDTQMFVTHAKMATISGIPFVALGPGNGGYVDIYHLDGTFEGNLISGGSLDEPWGVAIAPASFGSYSGKLLVGNFGDGKINVFDPSNGSLLGTLNDFSGNPIVITGLWALVVNNGTLYYTAGPASGADGVFGKITVR